MICSNCGKEIADDSMFCEFCGVKVEVNKPANRKKLWIILGAVLGVAVLALILVFVLGGKGSENKDYVDLGLPSGTQWKLDNESGYYTYEEAMDKFAGQLPTKGQIEELLNYCSWQWGSDGRSMGYFVAGHNGNAIFIPAEGIIRLKSNEMENVGQAGVYWSSSSCVDCISEITKYVLSFGREENPSISTTDDLWKKAFTVRLVDRSRTIALPMPAQPETQDSDMELMKELEAWEEAESQSMQITVPMLSGADGLYYYSGFDINRSILLDESCALTANLFIGQWYEEKLTVKSFDANINGIIMSAQGDKFTYSQLERIKKLHKGDMLILQDIKAEDVNGVMYDLPSLDLTLN